MWKMLYMQWEFKGILRNPLYNNLNFPVKINVRSGIILVQALYKVSLAIIKKSPCYLM